MKNNTIDFGNWVIEHRWRIIIATIIVVGAAAYGIKFLTINNDTRVYFGKKNTHLQALEKLENTYNRINNIFFVAAPKDGSVFTRTTLTMLEEFTEESWQLPFSSRVNSITNFQHAHAEDDELIVRNLVENAAGLSIKDITRIKSIVLSEPLLLNNLVSPSGHVAGIDVNVLLPGRSIHEVPEIAAAARDLADTFRTKYPEIDIYITGAVMIDNAFGEASQKDMKTLIPAMFLVLMVIVGIALGSITGTVVTFIIILISMVTGLGIAGWLGMSINSSSVNAPTIILTLAVADSVHILTTMFFHMRRGKTKHEAIAESIRINMQAVFLTSVTTVVGFLSMNLSDAPPFHDLGNIVALGVSAAFVYSMLFLPSLMSVLPLRTVPDQRGQDKVCSNVAGFIIRKKNSVFWSALIIVFILGFGIFRNEFNDNFLKYFDDSFDFRRATDFSIDNLRGWDIIEYSLEAGESGGINNPAYLKTVEKFADWYSDQPNVVHVYTILDTIKRLNKNMHGDDESFYAIPEERNLAAQYLLLYEMSLPFGLDLNNILNVDKSASRMIVTMKSMNSTEMRVMDEKAYAWLKENAPKHMLTQGTGLSIIWAHITKRNIRSMLWALFLALVVISVILVVTLRSVKIGLISIIPNLTPAVMAFGVWGFINGQIGLGLSVTLAMTIGIVVDDTVHFLSTYLRARRQYGNNAAEAVMYSFRTVGTAMWVTTVALVGGFSMLVLSHYRMSSDMGLMAAITIAFALLMDFFLLPTLLIKIDT